MALSTSSSKEKHRVRKCVLCEEAIEWRDAGWHHVLEDIHIYGHGATPAPASCPICKGIIEWAGSFFRWFHMGPEKNSCPAAQADWPEQMTPADEGYQAGKAGQQYTCDINPYIRGGGVSADSMGDATRFYKGWLAGWEEFRKTMRPAPKRDGLDYLEEERLT